MHPFHCLDGKDHNFDFKGESPERQYVCLNCGVTYDEFNKAQLKIKKLTDMIKEMSGTNNGGNPKFLATALLNAMNEEHRTLQQSFINSIALFIKMMSEMPIDLRNQAAVEWCKKVSEIEAIFPRI